MVRNTFEKHEYFLTIYLPQLLIRHHLMSFFVYKVEIDIFDKANENLFRMIFAKEILI